MLKRDFASKYFEVFRTNPPSVINHVLPSLILGLSSFIHESAETEEL